MIARTATVKIAPAKFLGFNERALDWVLAFELCVSEIVLVACNNGSRTMDSFIFWKEFKLNLPLFPSVPPCHCS